jgi:beta-lactamase regulating signal transducer with metallopeptidase domain
MREILSQCVEFLNGAGESYWHFAGMMFVQATMLVLVLLAVELLLRRRVRAVVRYWLWMLVLVKLVLPVDLRTPVSLAYWLPSGGAASSRPVDRDADAGVPRSEIVHGAALVADSRRQDLNSIPDAAAPDTAHIRPVERSDVPARPTQIATAANVAAPLQWHGALFAFWILAVAILLAMVGRRAMWVRRITRQATDAPRELEDLLRDCMSQMGTKWQVKLRISDHLGSPAICGLWRPTIHLPRGFPAGLDREQIRMVFMHELVHWRRGDLPVNCLQTVLQIIYFYNPAVWIANLIIRRLREQAVDETVLVARCGRPERYASTLLDIASAQLKPVETMLRLIGVVESRTALAARIKRITGLPIPRTAKLGFASVLTVLLVGTVLLPMGRRQQVSADDPPHELSHKPATAGGPPQGTNPDIKLADNEANLSGRLVDEIGQPVTDAMIRLFYTRTGKAVGSQSDEKGRYRFTGLKDFGEYQIDIKSHRWVGITDHRSLPHVDIGPQSHLVRDFSLPRACRLRVRVVDEQGHPIPKVFVDASLPGEMKNFGGRGTTDADGWATLDAMKPSSQERVVATRSDDYAAGQISVTLNDPAVFVDRLIVLQKGLEVKGTAVCSDGKPPVGWRIHASSVKPHPATGAIGSPIGSDGSFTILQITPGIYDIIVDIPVSDYGLFTPTKVLASVKLPSDKPLAVKIDYPSPASMATISGEIEITGGTLQRGFHILAYSSAHKYLGDAYVLPGQREFKIGPIPRATYTVSFESTEFESLTLSDVVNPSERLHVKLKILGALRLRGTVVSADTHKPVSHFRVQVAKQRTLRGPNYVQDSAWHEFKDERGAFSVDLIGPGIYSALVAADGFALARIESFDTEGVAQREIRVELMQGVPLSGTVMDDRGASIDGAKIISLPNESLMPLNESNGQTTAGDVIAETRDGAFTIPHFTPVLGRLKVVHPDYSPTIVENIKEIQAGKTAPLTVTLHRGATVHGHVYDEYGKPEKDVVINFQDRNGYNGPTAEKQGRIATGIADRDGYYEVRHLPDGLWYVQRPDPWRSRGVVRHAVQTADGNTQTLDFGGTNKLTGRLIVNGAPLANAKVELSDENPLIGTFQAFARTDASGTFVFWGPPAGRRTLYFATPEQSTSWVRARELTVTPNGGDVGAIECAVARLTVRVEPATESLAQGIEVALHEYDPVWLSGGFVAGKLLERQNRQDPNVFEQVPQGKFEITCSRPNQFSVRKAIEITSEREQTASLELPRATASLSGKLDASICGPNTYAFLNVWSKDQRLIDRITPKEDGTYRLEHIPAGNYSISDTNARDVEPLLSFSVQDGENKILDITPQTVAAPKKPTGIAFVRVFTPDGVRITGCEVRFEGSEHPPTLKSSQEGRLVFVGVPGAYDALIGFPGFKTIRQKLEIKSVKKGGGGEFIEAHIRLEPNEN